MPDAVKPEDRTMRRDHDYVTMEDYCRDMKESSDRATSIIEYQAYENRQLRALISALIRGAGGMIEVSIGDLVKAKPTSFEVWDDDCNRKRIFRIIRET
jgi:hypothetical protein